MSLHWSVFWMCVFGISHCSHGQFPVFILKSNLISHFIYLLFLPGVFPTCVIFWLIVFTCILVLKQVCGRPRQVVLSLPIVLSSLLYSAIVKNFLGPSFWVPMGKASFMPLDLQLKEPQSTMPRHHWPTSIQIWWQAGTALTQGQPFSDTNNRLFSSH